ncbi:MAG: hypothetical protein H6811_06670 [Phycisphaeraceae bacterium]|nr:hypothetical protein [Phycisphaeraceae bacterium]
MGAARRGLPIILAVGSVPAVLLGAGLLEDRAAALRASMPIRVVIHWPSAEGLTTSPTESWLPEAQQRDLVALARDSLGESPEPFRIDPLERLGRAMGASGWFEGQPTIRRAGGGVIHVVGEWRRPTAWIRFGADDYLVDDRGRLMPLTYGATEASPPRTPVLNPGTRPPRRPSGEPDYVAPWTSDSARAAIELIDLLHEQPYWAQVAAVDAGGKRPDLRLVIETDRGTRIVWGGAPNAFNPGERSTQDKLRQLANFYNRPEYGRHIDAGSAGYDLRSELILFDISPGAQPTSP